MRAHAIVAVSLVLCCGCEKHQLSPSETARMRVGGMIATLKTNATMRTIQLSGDVRNCLKEIEDLEEKKGLVFCWRDALFNVSVAGLNSEERYGVVKESATLLDWDVACAMNDVGCTLDEVWMFRFRVVDWLDNHLILMRKACDKGGVNDHARRANWTYYQALAEYREQLVENFERFYLDERDFVAQEDYLETLRQKLSVKLGRPVRRPSEIKRIGIYVRQVRERIRKERGFHGVRPH